MTDTAKYADIVLPAASYLETDDLYRAYGAYWMQWGRQAAKPQGEARSNFDVAQALAQRMGLDATGSSPCAAGRREGAVQGRDRPGIEGRARQAVRRRADPHQARLERPALRHAVGQARVLFRAARQAGPLAPARLEPRSDRGGRRREVAAAPADRARLLPGAHGLLRRGLPARARRQAVLHPPSRGRRQARPEGRRRGAPVQRPRRGRPDAQGQRRGPARRRAGAGPAPDSEAISGTINMLCSDRYTDMGEGATYQSTWLDVGPWKAAS